MNNYSTNFREPVSLPGGQIIGYQDGRTFFKTVQASKHMLRKPPGWSSNVDVLVNLESLGVIYFELNDTESGKRYRATIQAFWKHGIEINRGCGKQIVLPLKYWETDPQKMNPGKSKTPKPVKSQQMVFPF